jgi:hypothetical protein
MVATPYLFKDPDYPSSPKLTQLVSQNTHQTWKQLEIKTFFFFDKIIKTYYTILLLINLVSKIINILKYFNHISVIHLFLTQSVLLYSD